MLERTITSRQDSPDNPIFIVGAPRSGTTWLAKIFDSHPDVVYRHEPDDCNPPPSHLSTDTLNQILAVWRNDCRLRTSSKRPFFRKSWRTGWRHNLRVGIAYALLAAGRVPGLSSFARHCNLPRLGDARRARLVVKSVRWCDGVGDAARILPNSRTIVIIRRPRAQVNSVMRGASQHQFELREYRTLPINLERAMARAARDGVDAARFATLPDSAKYAWDWVAFNETLKDTTQDLDNVLHVRYEDLSSRPLEVAKQLFAFAGLTWTPQTEQFILASTQAKGTGGYYDVVKNSAQVANRWRGEMSEADATAVVDVARRSKVSRYYPDLSPTQA